MRLTGDIQVYNRMLPSYNIPNKRSEWSYLSIGYYSSQVEDVYILHQTQKNGIGNKYKIFGNLLDVFTKYIFQGKMTLRFKKPTHDLIILTDEEQLSKFCRILQELMKNGKNRRKLSNLSNVPTKVGPKPKTKLVIRSKKDMPTVEPFPRTLEILQIISTGLTRLDARIFRLQKLKILNLENNCLESLPEQLSLLPCLKELHLSGNLLGHTPLNKWLMVETLQSELVHLDLRKNIVHKLPSDIYRLKKLKTLLLDDNLLHNLPNTFGRLPDLKKLSLSNNRLIALPASFRILFLEFLDISCNPGWLTNYGVGQNVDTYESSSSALKLVDISAKSVLNNRLEYDRKTLPLELITYLDTACYCVCGQPTFPSTPEGHCKLDIAKICIQLTFTECILPVEVRFCSNRCRTACGEIN